MNKPVQMNRLGPGFENGFTIDHLFSESGVMDSSDDYYSEAVFASGKGKLEPILTAVTKCKEVLEEEIAKQTDADKDAKKHADDSEKNKSKYKFKPKQYWKNTCWKDLEDSIQKVFGFRSVQVFPFIEKYNSEEKIFESKTLNAYALGMDRFPIEGLVTDNGFYDKSRSINVELYFSLGIIKALEPDEILAIFLHELGHGIDPALVTISYSTANAMSKYLTDRTSEFTKAEKKVAQEQGGFLGVMSATTMIIGTAIGLTLASLIAAITHKPRWEKQKAEKLNQIKSMVKKDKEFSHQNYSEAFADNFARMYGYGPQLMRAIAKCSKDMDRRWKSRITKEEEREKFILQMTEDMLKDVHKTEVHRMHALINEYKKDIADPNTPATVKKQLQDDCDELEKILNKYLHQYDDFQNHINQMIDKELTKMENKKAPKEDSKEEKEEKKEE